MSELKIFQKVKTPDGKGILINIETPFNGLSISYEQAKCTVWYGMDSNQNGKVSWEYPLKEIEKLNK